MEYIAPGLVMMSVITNSYGNVVGSFFNAKIQGHIEELLVSPLSEISIVIGYLAGGIIRVWQWQQLLPSLLYFLLR